MILFLEIVSQQGCSKWGGAQMQQLWSGTSVDIKYPEQNLEIFMFAEMV